MTKYHEGGYVQGTTPTRGSYVYYQHDRPDGTKDHLISIESARTGTCSICGEQVFDPDHIAKVFDKLNQEWRNKRTVRSRLVRLFGGKR